MRPVLLVKKCRFLKTRVRVFTSFIPEALTWFSSISKTGYCKNPSNHSSLGTKIDSSYNVYWFQALVAEKEEKSEVGRNRNRACWKEVVKKRDLGNRWSTQFDWHEEAIKGVFTWENSHRREFHTDMTFWFRIAFTWWLGYFTSRYLKVHFMLITCTYDSKSRTLRMRYPFQSTGRPISHRNGWSFRV